MNTENKIPDSASEFGGGLFMMKNYYLTQKYSHAAHLFEKNNNNNDFEFHNNNKQSISEVK